MNRLSNSHKQDKSLFVLENLYAKNQIVCAIHTLDAVSMEKVRFEIIRVQMYLAS